MSMTCQNCHRPLPPGSSFCENCGARVSPPGGGQNNRNRRPNRRRGGGANPAVIILIIVLALALVAGIVIGIIALVKKGGKDQRGQEQQVPGFAARKEGEGLVVREQVRAADGMTFPDVEGWFWQALAGQTSGPWLVISVASRGRP